MSATSEFLSKYEIIRELGHGGMAQVFLARDKRLDRLVALKTIHASPAIMPGSSVHQLLERVQREAMAIAKMKHPGIVTIHDVLLPEESEAGKAEAEKTIYLALEYIDGPTLDKFCAALPGRRLPEEQALQIGIDIAAALVYAHRLGIVHRDIKPSNAMMEDETKRVVLLDFSLSYIFGAQQQQTLTHQSIGTPAYMSPEQILHPKEVEYRTDVYSLGLTLYFLLTGAPPFHDQNFFRLCEKQVSEPLPPLCARFPEISPLTERTINLAAAKEPSARAQSAKQLHDLLKGVLRFIRESKQTGAQPDPARVEELFCAAVVPGVGGEVKGTRLSAPMETMMMPEGGLPETPSMAKTPAILSQAARQPEPPMPTVGIEAISSPTMLAPSEQLAAAPTPSSPEPARAQAVAAPPKAAPSSLVRQLVPLAAVVIAVFAIGLYALWPPKENLETAKGATLPPTPAPATPTPVSATESIFGARVEPTPAATQPPAVTPEATQPPQATVPAPTPSLTLSPTPSLTPALTPALTSAPTPAPSPEPTAQRTPPAAQSTPPLATEVPKIQTPVSPPNATADAALASALGFMTGAGGRLDRAKAKDLILQSVEAGNALAKMWAARCYQGGRSQFPLDLDQARRLATEAFDETKRLADAGDPDAMFLLASALEEGLGCQPNRASAMEWYGKAAQKGSVHAMVSLGEKLLEGSGAPKDENTAASWFQKAADKGVVEAMSNLASMCLQGKGVAPDDAKAVSLLRKAAEMGDVHSMTGWALLLEDGRGIGKDETEAANWYRRAADTGDEMAMRCLGRLYAEGRGVRRDDGEAANWFTKAAEKGDRQAMGLLGDMYLSGRGVPQSNAKAKQWLIEGARLGDKNAQNILKDLGEIWQ